MEQRESLCIIDMTERIYLSTWRCHFGDIIKEDEVGRSILR